MRFDFGYSEEKQLGKPYDVKLLKRIYPFTRPYFHRLAAAICMVIGITLLDLSLPYITKIAIDRYIVPQGRPAQVTVSSRFPEGSKDHLPKQTMERPAQTDSKPPRFQHKKDAFAPEKDRLAGVARMTLIFLGIIFLNFVLNFIQLMLMEYTGQMIMHDLRIRLFSHIQQLSMSFFSHNPVGRLVTRVTNDIQNMHELFASIIIFVFKDLFLLIGISVVLFSISRPLALATFAVLPLVILASVHFAMQAREAYRTLRIKVAEINTRFSETISGIKVIQLFRQEARNYRRFAELNHENYLAGMRQVHVFAVFMPVIEVISALALAIIIYYGGGQVVSQHITLGALVAFISYIRIFFRPIRDIAEKYNIMQNAMASAERIFLILDKQDHPAAGNKAPGADQWEQSAGLPPVMPQLDPISSIAFEDVGFAYDGKNMVLSGVSFTVEAGETVALVGPTGSGKTSLINLMLRLYDPLSGRILINHSDIQDYDLGLLRSKIALVAQDPFLFSKSIRENIIQGNPKITDVDLNRVITAANCEVFIQRLPQGIDTVLSEGGASISSGERQLISIARALARNPQLIILDEATSYIDSATEQRIQGALARLLKGRTAMVVAHRLSTARGADRIIVLKQGRIIESGTHENLMKKRGFYHKLTQLRV